MIAARSLLTGTLLTGTLLTGALLTGSSFVSGCVHVKPYQREYLSKPSMSPTDETLETSFQAHLRESREGASAGSSAAGGGCGCN